MQSRQSIYIIKPEAIPFSEDIHKMIASSGLTISIWKQAIMPYSIIDKIYFDCPKDIIAATKHFMFNDICEIGIVSGDNAIEKLIEVCGTETNPFNCKKGTIRNLFGVHKLQFYNGTGYYQNAIHRPKTEIEFKKDIDILEDIVKL